VAWENDLLDREKEGEFLLKYLLAKYERDKDLPYVLNINSEWGFGKTNFLENMTLDLKEKKHPVVYFDAWKNDYTDNPLLAFISELNSSLDSYFSRSPKTKELFKETINAVKNTTISIVSKKLTGYAADEVEELYKSYIDDSESDSVDNNSKENEFEQGVASIIAKASEISLQEHQTIKNSIETFKINMAKLLKRLDNMESKKLPMFIMIDELDRCRPNYAIELLENIKHLFDVPGIYFIVATDSRQLAHSIKAVYGSDFSSERYLKRFFNQEYNLLEPDSYIFAKSLFEKNNLLDNTKLFSPINGELNNNSNAIVELFRLYSDFFQLSLRDQEQCVDLISAIALTWDRDNFIHLGYLLFLIILKQRNSEEFIKYHNMSESKKRSAISPDYISSMLGTKTTITFKDYTFDSNMSGNITSHNINEVIKAYSDNLDKNIEQLVGSNKQPEFKDKIMKKIRSELPSSWISNKEPPKYDFSNYTSLVMRVSNFS